jgi:hypothetical protein
VPKSVDELVAEAVERVKGAALVSSVLHEATLSQAHIEFVLTAARYPALVEALSFYADPSGYDYDETASLMPDNHNDVLGDNGQRARVVLGGEVPSTGRGELEAENRELRERLEAGIEGAEFFLASAAKFGDDPPYGMQNVLNRLTGSAVDGETTTTKGTDGL